MEKIILAGLAGCGTWSDLERLVQRAVITADPDGARRRRDKAQREHARLRFWRENWGTCAMQATGLPPDEALAANARIEARARAYKAAAITRPMDILRVMAYLDLINDVTIAQRAAWAQADAAANAAAAPSRDQAREDQAREDQEQAARDAQLRKTGEKARENARRRAAASNAGNPGQHPEPGQGHGDPPGDDNPGHPEAGQPAMASPETDGARRRWPR